MRPGRGPRRALAALTLGLGAACSTGPAEPVVPEVVDLSGLEARLRPTTAEKALLVNFWATW